MVQLRENQMTFVGSARTVMLRHHSDDGSGDRRQGFVHQVDVTSARYAGRRQRRARIWEPCDRQIRIGPSAHSGTSRITVLPPPLSVSLSGGFVFHAPQDLDVVTAPIDVVATIEGEAIDRWTLSYQYAGEGQPVELATGTGSFTNATLAQFDPTLLLNGLYDIVLTAWDIAGQSASKKISVDMAHQRAFRRANVFLKAEKETLLPRSHFTLILVDISISIFFCVLHQFGVHKSSSRLDNPLFLLFGKFHSIYT